MCKKRRKKCDETKPQCRRCVASGKTCSYEYIEYSEADGHLVKRTKPAPRIASRRLTVSQNTPAGPVIASTPSISRSSNVLARPNVGAHSNEIGPNSALVAPHTILNSQPLSFNSPTDSWQIASGSNPINPSPIFPDYSPLPTNTTLGTTGLISQGLTTSWDENEGEVSDPEGVRFLLCTSPALDKNARDNTLPFVLDCYSQWAVARVFEPIKIARLMREQVVTQFSSESTRTRTVLIANIMDMFAKNLAIDGARKLILDQLVSDGQKNGSIFIAAPSSAPDLDKSHVLRTLGNILEVFSLQIFTQSLSACIQSLGDAAPAFRHACSEPPGQPIDLANLLLSPHMSLQYFATLDIIQSVTTGLPTHFPYIVPYSLELCDKIYWLQDNYGLQWQLGFPDQFILMFAWINSLCETPEASNNTELVAWIETNVPQIKVAIDESGDPLLRIGRMVVLECWRFAVLIYLYMVLCKADAHDPRVKRAQKAFVRLVKGVQAGRLPDAHLSPPMVIAGVATIGERDRDLLRHRILGVQEFAERGTVGNDYMMMLEDVWARTTNEGRPAVWSDLRIACFRVTGW